jgi:hypothetical protein
MPMGHKLLLDPFVLVKKLWPKMKREPVLSESNQEAIAMLRKLFSDTSPVSIDHHAG